MDKQILIVGHGLAGCVMALTCYRRNVPFRLIGYSRPGEASMASSGLIAPVTGRRYVKAWLIDEFIAKALDFYNWSEKLFDGKYFFPVEIVRFLSNDEANAAWKKRLKDPGYSAYISDKTYAFLESFGRPYGILTGGFRLDTPAWMEAARNFLASKALLRVQNEPFHADSDVDQKIIFATGAVEESIALGIIPNKGEALILQMPDWKIPLIVKDDVFIIPLKEEDSYWVGSYYHPGNHDPSPSEQGREQILHAVSKIYSGKLEVQAHLAGVRPTVDDRRPLIGDWPGRKNQYIFNGMGTKGTSLAPFWADQLLTHVLEGAPLLKEVSPERYAG